LVDDEAKFIAEFFQRCRAIVLNTDVSSNIDGVIGRTNDDLRRRQSSEEALRHHSPVSIYEARVVTSARVLSTKSDRPDTVENATLMVPLGQVQ
jgi:hypothetical protein